MLTINLASAVTMPAEVDVPAIAEAALQAAFKTIADGLEEHGYPVTGDFSPGEVQSLDDAFAAFVCAMALNNPTVAALNNEEA